MFKKLIELREQKAEKVAEMRSMLEKAEKENRSLNESESVEFEKLKDSSKMCIRDRYQDYEGIYPNSNPRVFIPIQDDKDQYLDSKSLHVTLSLIHIYWYATV